jgi:hypothetical protein
MKIFDKIMINIEKKVGLSIKKIDDKNPVEISKHIEKMTGNALTFSSEFPFIGRGNILRDGLIESNRINQDIDKILGL